MNHEIQLSDHFDYRRLIRFTFPSVLMMIFTSIYGVVDGFFVSNLVGKTPFAAVNFIMPFLIVVGAMGFMFGTGGSALIAKIMGEGKQRKHRKYFPSGGGHDRIRCRTCCFEYPVFAADRGTYGCQWPDAGRLRKIRKNHSCGTAVLMLQYAFSSLVVTAEKPRLGLAVTIITGVLNMTGDALFMAVFHWGSKVLRWRRHWARWWEVWYL